MNQAQEAVTPREASRLVDLSAQVFQIINVATQPATPHKRMTKSQEVHFVIDVLKDLANRSYPNGK